MPHLRDTAYPRLKSSFKQQELDDIYTPTESEVEFCHRITKRDKSRAHFLFLLKTFQRLGYFHNLAEVSEQLITHFSVVTHTPLSPTELVAYDASLSKRRHQLAIRKFCGIRAYGDEARPILARAAVEGARLKDDLADIINVSIEELVRNRFELPAFSTLLRAAKSARSTVNRGFFRRMNQVVTVDERTRIDSLFEVPAGLSKSPWDGLKREPGRPSREHLRELLQHQSRLAALPQLTDPLISEIPESKRKQFALEAASLDAARMINLEPNKRTAIALCLIHRQRAKALDDLGEMLVKRMMKIHHNAKEALERHQIAHRAVTDQLLGQFEQVLEAYQQEDKSVQERMTAMQSVIGADPKPVLERLKAQLAFSGNNYYAFLWSYYKPYRSLLFELLRIVPWVSTNQDKDLISVIEFMQTHADNRSEWLTIPSTIPVAHLLTDRWWKLVTGKRARDQQQINEVHRKYFELCVFSQLTWELKSGDIAISGADQFADYRSQLLSLAECQKRLEAYGTQAGIEVEPKKFVQQLKTALTEQTARLDESFPANDSIRIENGEPVLCKLKTKGESEKLRSSERIISSRLPTVGILDALIDSERWLGWTRYFGPLSGFDSKIEHPALKYVASVFCYGCNLGPTQTARSIQSVERRQLAWINQRHMTEEKLDEAITQVINGYNQFSLPKLWGSGKHASADGTRWNLYEENLLSEYHIRYGGYGGIGYYHVSDTYIALFSHFIPCGVWEAVYILDGLLKNKSDIQPDTLHADTQGQSSPVFALAYLLGIDLMPRIRNWKDIKLYRPDQKSRYTHIDSLFTEESIDWKLIETHLPDMMQVALSIQAGRITASTILRRLGTYSRKNRLYFAFRELGRVIRSRFLIRYIGSQELRSTIQGATNKSEAFNGFTKWVFFGGEGIIGENSRDEQRKIIKYNHLVANLLIFHTVHGLTRTIYELGKEGISIDDEVLTQISPYLTEHINRFGNYALDPDRQTPPLELDAEGSFQYRFPVLS